MPNNAINIKLTVQHVEILLTNTGEYIAIFLVVITGEWHSNILDYSV